MLIKATDKNHDEITAFCNGTILGTRISALVGCYKFGYNFFDVMLSCDNETNEINAVISVFDGNVTIHTKGNFDVSEVSSYLNMISFKSLTAEKETMIKLGFNGFKEKTAYKFLGNKSDVMAENADESDYKFIYNLISDSIPDSFSKDKQAYLSWLSDFTFRKRRNVARIKCLKENNTVISCAMTAAESYSGAVISGVACDKNNRKKGAGKAVVLSLANELTEENKDVFVIALNDSAKSFYEHIGFKKECVMAISER